MIYWEGLLLLPKQKAYIVQNEPLEYANMITITENNIILIQ